MKLEHEVNLNRTEMSMIEYWGQSFADYEQCRVWQNTGELTVDLYRVKIDCHRPFLRKRSVIS